MKFYQQFNKYVITRAIIARLVLNAKVNLVYYDLN